jgi:hypothetical protein
MTITVLPKQTKTIMSTFAFTMLMIVGLTGCGSEGKPSTPTALATNPYISITEDDPRAQAFISEFRASYPQLVGDSSRPDKYVLKNGSHLCAEIFSKEMNQAYHMTFQDMKQHVIPRVRGGDVQRDATEEEADGVVRLALNTICPEYSTVLE